jgi:uncharacterized protein (TIGR02001 family)
VPRLALIAWGLLYGSSCSSCWAQLAAQVGIASDSVFRGVSLSGGRPAPWFALSEDGPEGWFLGSQISTVQFAPAQQAVGELVAYGGVTRQLDSGNSAEVGVTGTTFPGAPGYSYGELFVGLDTPSWSSRLYLSPNYFNQSVRTLYAEINASRQIASNLIILGHVGMLTGLSSDSDSANRAADIRIGLGLDLAGVSLQLAWTDVSRVAYLYPTSESSARRRWIASASCAF